MSEPRLNYSPIPWKYGRGHWAGCTCTDCTAAFEIHNLNGVCHCDSCTMHRTKQPLEQEAQKMAGVNICDRCEAMVKGNALGELVITTSQERDHETIVVELCPDCIGKFVNMAEQTSVPPLERAYKQAWRRQESKSEDSLTDAVRKAVRLELESGNEPT